MVVMVAGSGREWTFQRVEEGRDDEFGVAVGFVATDDVVREPRPPEARRRGR
jgi:hypothetical protein